MGNNYGLLINGDTKLQRQQFREMTELLGVFCQYQFPLRDKDYTSHGDLVSSYSSPCKVGCIFADHIDQKTAKLLGWNSELQTEASIIHVPYDLENLQVGCLFEIPSAFDNTKGRLFRVDELSAKMIYPASIACRLSPYYVSLMERADTELFVNTDFNLLNSGE